MIFFLLLFWAVLEIIQAAHFQNGLKHGNYMKYR